MKKVYLIFAVAFLIIAGVMLYLVKAGVSLRPALYIKPSAMTAGTATVSRDLGLRLFPDLQDVDYVVWGIAEADKEANEIFQRLKADEEKSKGKTITVLKATSETEQAAIDQCKNPCWIVQGKEAANELKPGSFAEKYLLPKSRRQGTKYFTLTVTSFQFGLEVPQECWAERRLDFECIQAVSVQTVERKMPKEARGKPQAERGRYFFLNKYNDSDFFLFLESPLSPQ